MKHSFPKRLTALLLMAMMIVAMVPLFVMGASAADSIAFEKVEITTLDNLDLTAQYVITYNTYALKAVVSSGRLSNEDFNASATTISDDSLWTIAKSGENYTLYNKATNSYAAGTGVKNKAQLLADSADTKAQWTVTVNADGTFEFVNVANSAAGVNKTLRNNGTNGWACYSTSTGDALTLYKVVINSCQHTNKEAIGTPAEPTCTEDGITAGVKCKDCGATLEAQETLPAAHKFVDGICSVCGDEAAVKIGSVVYLTNAEKKSELTGISTTSTKYGTIDTYDMIPSKFPLLVEEGATEGSYALKTFAGQYLSYESGNTLIVSDTKDESSSWLITTDGEETKVENVGTKGRYLRYNPSSPRFACYTSGQNAVTFITAPYITSFGLTLNKGVTVKVNYTVPAAWLEANADAKVTFKIGETVLSSVAATKGPNTYSVNLTPAQINGALTLDLVLGDTVLTSTDVSVAAYAAKVNKVGADSLKLSTGKYKELQDLLNAIKTYGSYADGTATDEQTAVFEDNGAFATTSEMFEGVSAVLGEYASLKVNVKVDTDCTIKVEQGGKVLFADVALTADDTSIVITGLYPMNFNDVITISTPDLANIATLSFNGYLKAVYDSTEDAATKNLIAATYLYGVAAEAFAAPETTPAE